MTTTVKVTINAEKLKDKNFVECANAEEGIIYMYCGTTKYTNEGADLYYNYLLASEGSCADALQFDWRGINIYRRIPHDADLRDWCKAMDLYQYNGTCFVCVNKMNMSLRGPIDARDIIDFSCDEEPSSPMMPKKSPFIDLNTEPVS